MEVTINITYYATLDAEDAEKIETGEWDASDIDWSYYVGEATDIEVESINIL